MASIENCFEELNAAIGKSWLQLMYSNVLDSSIRSQDETVDALEPNVTAFSQVSDGPLIEWCRTAAHVVIVFSLTWIPALWNMLSCTRVS